MDGADLSSLMMEMMVRKIVGRLLFNVFDGLSVGIVRFQPLNLVNILSL